MAKKTNKPAWLIPKKVGKLKPMSTRNIVKRHLKEWNFDKNKADRELIRAIKESMEDDKGKKVSFKEAKEILGPSDFAENREYKREAEEHFKRTGERM